MTCSSSSQSMTIERVGPMMGQILAQLSSSPDRQRQCGAMAMRPTRRFFRRLTFESAAEQSFARGCRMSEGFSSAIAGLTSRQEQGLDGAAFPHNFCMTSSAPTLDFLLYQWLKAETLQQRSRFPTIRVRPSTPVLDTSGTHRPREVRAVQPAGRSGRTRTETETDGSCAWCCRRPLHEARRAYAESGLLSAAQGLRHWRHATALHGRGGGQ